MNNTATGNSNSKGRLPTESDRNSDSDSCRVGAMHGSVGVARLRQSGLPWVPGSLRILTSEGVKILTHGEGVALA